MSGSNERAEIDTYLYKKSMSWRVSGESTELIEGMQAFKGIPPREATAFDVKGEGKEACHRSAWRLGEWRAK
eukprot:scaffold131083_cov18-Prasinocladus_malaysianus.AAC.1